jgi:hypothetical protein
MNIKPEIAIWPVVFAPNPEDLKKNTFDIAENHQQWNAILNADNQINFGDLKGNTVLTTSRGFQKDHVAIELIVINNFI